MSFWAYYKTAQIPLQSIQTRFFFFEMMHFYWSKVYDIELFGSSVEVPRNRLRNMTVKIYDPECFKAYVFFLLDFEAYL